RNSSGKAIISQLNTLSRSSKTPSGTRVRAARPKAGRRSEATVMSGRAIDFFQLSLGALDHVLGGRAGARLGEHVDHDVFGDAFRQLPARGRRPTRQMRGRQRIS